MEAGGLVPGERAGGGAGCGGGELGAGALISDQFVESSGESADVARWHQPRGSRLRHLGEAADGAEDEWLTEGEAGVEDAGVLGLEVGEDDEVGAAEDRRDLSLVNKTGDGADATY